MTDKRVTPDDRQLLKKLKNASNQDLHDSLKKWETAKDHLTEVEALLIRAYQDLESMRTKS